MADYVVATGAPLAPLLPLRTPAVTVPVRPTMRDVAAAASVSLKTVSRVVNGEPGVAAATAARVSSAIAQLGFRPNDLARSLRPGQSATTLGLVIGDVSNTFYSAIARAVEDVAKRHAYRLVTGSSDEDPAAERELVLDLCQRRVDGLIIVPAGTDHRYLLREIELGTKVVFIDRPPGRIRGDLIVLDNVNGARQAVEHLIRQGHRRIAMVGDRPDINTQVERFQGYREALAEHRLKLDETLVREGAHDVPQAQAAVTSLLAMRKPPTAIFTANNLITLGALRAMRAGERRLALVGFDDFELADMLPVPITVVRSDAAEIGRQAAELLFARLAGDARPPQKIVLPTELVIRGSGETQV